MLGRVEVLSLILTFAVPCLVLHEREVRSTHGSWSSFSLLPCIEIAQFPFESELVNPRN